MTATKRERNCFGSGLATATSSLSLSLSTTVAAFECVSYLFQPLSLVWLSSFSFILIDTSQRLCSQLQNFVIVANDTYTQWYNIQCTLSYVHCIARCSIIVWIKYDFCSWINVNRLSSVSFTHWIISMCIFNAIHCTFSPTNDLFIPHSILSSHMHVNVVSLQFCLQWLKFNERFSLIVNKIKMNKNWN